MKTVPLPKGEIMGSKIELGARVFLVRYTDAELRAYGDDRVRAVLEAAIEVCEAQPDGVDPRTCATLIRRLMP